MATNKEPLPDSADPLESEPDVQELEKDSPIEHIESEMGCLGSAFEARCARCVDAEIRAFALNMKDKETGENQDRVLERHVRQIRRGL